MRLAQKKGDRKLQRNDHDLDAIAFYADTPTRFVVGDVGIDGDVGVVSAFTPRRRNSRVLQNESAYRRATAPSICRCLGNREIRRLDCLLQRTTRDLQSRC